MKRWMACWRRLPVSLAKKPCTAFSHWQEGGKAEGPGRVAVERLDIRPLIDRQHRCMGWRNDGETDDAGQIPEQVRIG